MAELEIHTQRIKPPISGYNQLKVAEVWGRQIPYLLDGDKHDPLYLGPIYLGQTVILTGETPPLLVGRLADVVGLRTSSPNDSLMRVSQRYMDAPFWIRMYQAISREFIDPTITGKPAIETLNMENFEALCLPAHYRLAREEGVHCLAVKFKRGEEYQIISVGQRAIAARPGEDERIGVVEKLEVHRGFGLSGIRAAVEGHLEEVYYVTEIRRERRLKIMWEEELKPLIHH